jgi:hypothetical protein
MNAIDDHLLKSFRLTGEIVPSVGRGLLVASDSTFWQSVVQSPPAAGASILGAGATIRQLPPSTWCTPSLSLLPRLLNDPDTAGHENCCKRSSSSAAAAAAATGGARFRILMAVELRLARRPASHPTLGCRCVLLLLQLSFPPRSLLRHPQSASLQPSLFASVRTYHSALRPLQSRFTFKCLASGRVRNPPRGHWHLASTGNAYYRARMHADRKIRPRLVTSFCHFVSSRLVSVLAHRPGSFFNEFSFVPKWRSSREDLAKSGY